MSRIDYAAYLRSPEWAAQRERALRAAGDQCARCHNRSHLSGYVDDDGQELMIRVQLDVHHLTYDRVGAERPDDLVVLCHRCHAETHAEEIATRLAEGMAAWRSRSAMERP